eukprot:scaffold1472_cov300-Pinguiococcus_pyrenoidosus.AAC.1
MRQTNRAPSDTWLEILVRDGLPAIALSTLFGLAVFYGIIYMTHTDEAVYRRSFQGQPHVDRHIPAANEQRQTRERLKESVFSITMQDRSSSRGRGPSDVVVLRGHHVQDGGAYRRPPDFFFEHICFGIVFGDQNTDLDAELRALPDVADAILAFSARRSNSDSSVPPHT